MSDEFQKEIDSLSSKEDGISKFISTLEEFDKLFNGSEYKELNYFITLIENIEKIHNYKDNNLLQYTYLPKITNFYKHLLEQLNSEAQDILSDINKISDVDINDVNNVTKITNKIIELGNQYKVFDNIPIIKSVTYKNVNDKITKLLENLNNPSSEVQSNSFGVSNKYSKVVKSFIEKYRNIVQFELMLNLILKKL